MSRSSVFSKRLSSRTSPTKSRASSLTCMTRPLSPRSLISVAEEVRVVPRFRNAIGLEGRMSVRLQPNHPTDDAKGIAASMLDGLLYGCGDAVIGINPASDSLAAVTTLLRMLDDFRERYEVPTQSCVLTHVTPTTRALERGA